MRSFSKKLAFVLAAAMVVTSFAPAASAKAADEMAINKSSQILYVNEGINHKGGEVAAPGKGNVSVYDFSVKNKPADWKDTLSFKWTSSDEDVVTVAKGGVATAVSVGKATITCKVTDKATKETVATLKTKITVKANADEVEIINADDVAGLAYEIGATVDLNRAMYDENGNRTTKRGTVVTDYTRWIAEPSNGVTIDQKTGKYTFAEAGEFTLYCETYQSSKYKNTTATSEKITVTVADAGVEIKQTANVKFTLNFGTAVAALAVEDVNVDEIVKVAGGNDKVNYLVKAVTLSEDKKSADVELFFELTDGATYEVTVKGYDTETFVASNGAPVSAVLHSDQWNINKRNVTIGNNANIYATLYDAAGMDVTTAEKVAKLTFKIKYVDSEYETTDTTLYFTEAGDRAVVTAEYHTNEYLENGDEKDFFESAPYTFVAVSKSQVEVEKIVKYTTNGNLNMTKDSVKLDATELQELSVLIKMSDDPYSDALQLVDTFGQNIYSSDEINPETLGQAKFTSLTPDILDVYAGAGDEVVIAPRKEGTARIMVSYVTEVNGYDVETAIGIVTIKVTGKITLTSAKLSSNTVTVCVNPSEDASVLVANPFVQLDVTDQYYTGYGAYSVEWEGNNDLSKSVENALTFGNKKAIYTAEPYLAAADGIPDDWMSGFVINGDMLRDAMDGLKGNGKNNTSFSFTITVKDNNAPYGQKTVKLTVNAKRAVDTNSDKKVNEKDMSVIIEVKADALNGANKNAARFDTPENNQQQYYDRNTENAKDIKFSAYYAYDKTAKWQEVELLDILPDTKAGIQAAPTGCYYVINKGGKNITEVVVNLANKTDATQKFATLGGYDGAKNEMLLKVNSEKFSQYDGRKIAYTEEWTSVGNVLGAGTYEFIIYEIVWAKNNKGVYENKVVQKARSSMSLTCDAGAYKFLGREEAKITEDMWAVEGAADSSNAAILRAFKIADKDGSTFQDKNVTDTTVKFDNGQVRNYKIVTKEKGSLDDNTVYVDKIIFWDAIEYKSWTDEDGDAANETPHEAVVWAEYEVNVGYFVEFVTEE